ncbi:MAG: diphthine synthase [Candidatus Micrarchaeia archaeon]
MLYIIGTGLWRGDDISVRGAEVCKMCSKVYLDGYTRMFEYVELERLCHVIGKEPVIVERNELEERLSFLDEAKHSNVALLVPGDPMIATTHITIVIEAKRRGIDYEIIHGSSVYDALIGETGLHIYKIGGSCTIPMREKGIRPYSVYEKIASNLREGLHTIVFLDTSPLQRLSVGDALDILREIEEERRGGVYDPDRKIIVGCNIGSKSQRIVYKSIREIENMKFNGTCTLVFPGTLHFMEKELLDML